MRSALTQGDEEVARNVHCDATEHLPPRELEKRRYARVGAEVTISILHDEPGFCHEEWLQQHVAGRCQQEFGGAWDLLQLANVLRKGGLGHELQV